MSAPGNPASPNPLPGDSPYAPTLRFPNRPQAGSDLLSALDWDAPLSRPVEDLSPDKLIRDAPRIQAGPASLPSLGGIPLLARLGQGGMGAVYFGLHLRLRREVAVKVLPFHLAMQQPELVKRFFREAQMAARVQSPHLVGVLDVNEDHGLHYLVMEYVHGLSGGAYLRMRQQQESRRGLPEADVLAIGCAACEGLAAAHAQNVVHRDVKVENILIPWADPGRTLNLPAAKLADLGLGRSEEAGHTLTGTQATLGTPGYMAPEQASDARHAGPPADVFSLGATLFALLTGQAPFTGSSAFEVLLATAQKPHIPLRQLCPDVSPATEALIERCLQKSPEMRYRDGSELLAALHECASGVGPAQTQSPLPTPITGRPAPTPGYAPVQTPTHRPATPVAPVVTPASSAPTHVAPLTPARRGGWKIACASILLLAGGVGGGWCYLRQQHHFFLDAAERAMSEQDWTTARRECERASRFSLFQDTRRAEALFAEIERLAAHEKAVSAGRKFAQDGRWKEAEAAFLQALEIPGRADDRRAQDGLEEARRQIAFQERLAHAETSSLAQNWSEAKKLYTYAMEVPGFEADARALAGRRKAEQALEFGEALKRARGAIEAGLWDDALAAAQTAQAVSGYEQDPAANAVLAQARNGAAFELARASALKLLEERQFQRAAVTFDEARALAGQPNSPVSRDALALVVNGKTFASLLQDTEIHLRAEKWSDAQTALKSASALSGFAANPVATRLGERARNGALFAYHIEEGQKLLARRGWQEARDAFTAARQVPGFADDPRAQNGLEVAQRGIDFSKAVEEGRREAQAAAWARAQAAWQRALSLKGFEDDREALDGLKEAAAQLARQGKEQAYRSALAEAQRLRKAVPPGPREMDAWSAVLRAAQNAIATGHGDTEEAQALKDEAARAAQAAQGWLDSDRKLMEARAFFKQNDFANAAAALKAALALAPRTDTAEFQTALANAVARAEGRSYWDGDRKYLDYKDRHWLIGVRGKPLDENPFIGTVRLKPGTSATLLWVRVVEKEFYFIRDETHKLNVGFEIIRNENASSAEKTERSEWVGTYRPTPAKEGRWTLNLKFVRQYDKLNGGSGSFYPAATESEMTPQPDGSVLYDAAFWKPHPMERTGQEVSDEMAKRAIDAYLQKWP